MASTNDQPIGEPAPCNASKLAGREASFPHGHYCQRETGHDGPHCGGCRLEFTR